MRGNANNWKQYFKGLAVLLGIPILFLLGLAAYVYIANAVPQTGPLQSRVEPQVMLPWGEAAYAILLRGDAPEKATTSAVPIDMAFLIDVSGSMTKSLSDMSIAAHQVTKELSSDKTDLIRFALIRFDTNAEVTTEWTGDPEKLNAGLTQLRPFTGNNDSRRAFEELDKLLSRARPEAKKVVVFYTDGALEACYGCIPGPMTEAEMRAAAQKLRDGGVELYSVGPPLAEKSSLMIELTGSPTHVFPSVDTADLVSNFRSVTQGATGRSGGAQLSQRLDGRHFAAPLEGTAWTVDRSGALSLNLSGLPKVPTTYRHPLVPRSSGVWRVGLEPTRLTFTSEDGQLRTLMAARRPLMLVIGWLPLLLMLLPALLWSLFSFGRRQPALTEREILRPDILRPRPPSVLPALPKQSEEREAPVPTLFIGIGGGGRRALLATRAELKQAHLSRKGQPYRFLWLDVDVKESSREMPFDDWDDYPIETVDIPPTIYRTNDYVSQPAQTPEYLRWFDEQSYFNAPRENLNLAEGARGDRMLARRALFQWLQDQSSPLAKMVEQCKELSTLDSVDGTRQIVVFACADGGVGSGWFLDIVRLLRRITRRQQQRAEVEFVPEMIGVLCDSPERKRPQNRNALEMEIESTVLSGAFPQRLAYGPDAQELVDETDTESPCNWIFTAGGTDMHSVAAQCGELGAVLVERHPRAALFDGADTLNPRQVVSVRSRAVHVLPNQLYELVRYELLLRVVGPDILLDVEPAPGGGFALRPLAEDVAAMHLSEWVKSEPPSTPLHLLLSAASDIVLTPGYLRVMQSASAPDRDWFTNALAQSVTRRLHGHSDPDSSQWHRDWMPGDAIATLRLLAARLEQSVKPQVSAQGGSTLAIEVLEHTARLADSVADQLEEWVRDFSEEVARISRQRSELRQIRKDLSRLSDRTYIDPPSTSEQVGQLTKGVFESWLGTPDTTSAIRERLFFAATSEPDRLRVSVRSYVEEAREFNTAAETTTALDAYMSLLARGVPTVRIGGVLAGEPKERREVLARGLVDIGTAPRKVLVVLPRADDRQGLEPQVLEEFKAMIPQPASHGLRQERAGDDQAAVRRLELNELSEPDDEQQDVPFIAVAEQKAEQLRKRAEKKYGLFVPAFPPELRIALAQGEAFLSFALAYKAGHIIPQEDAVGATQWALQDTREFLTSGSEPSLAVAAANYVWYVESPPKDFSPVNDGGAFTKLQNWLQNRNLFPDTDTLVQIAIDVYED